MIIFTSHALSKLEQRGILRAVVIETLRSPDYKFRSYSNRNIIYKKFDNLYLKVIYKIEDNNTIIITQYWEKNPKLIK